MAVTYDELVPLAVMHWGAIAPVALQDLDRDGPDPLSSQYPCAVGKGYLLRDAEHLVELAKKPGRARTVSFNISEQGAETLGLIHQLIKPTDHDLALLGRSCAKAIRELTVG